MRDAYDSRGLEGPVDGICHNSRTLFQSSCVVTSFESFFWLLAASSAADVDRSPKAAVATATKTTDIGLSDFIQYVGGLS